MNEDEAREFLVTIEKYRDGDLEPSEFDAFQKILINDPDAREMFVDLQYQAAHLSLGKASSKLTFNSEQPAPRQTVRAPARSRTLWIQFAGVTTIAASLLGLIVWWQLTTSDGPDVSKVPIASVIEAHDAQWGACSLPTAVGSELMPGRLHLIRGLATIRFSSGVVLTMESPATLELQTPMSGTLLGGTAVVDVPNNAHGFTLKTPTAVAVDHGTAFAVTVDHDTQTSSIEVLEGEVEVQHIRSHESLRLREKQRVIASQQQLGHSLNRLAETALRKTHEPTDASPTIRITTAEGNGQDATITRGNDAEVQSNSRGDLLLIKNPFSGYEKFSRKAYLSFDLAPVKQRTIRDARLLLTMLPSGLGYASRVGDCEFVVYGLIDGKDALPRNGTIDWQSAPGNSDGPAEMRNDHALELGRFVVPRGVQYGLVSIANEKLTGFLNDDANQNATLVIVRATTETAAGGLVHGFANSKSESGNPPTLLLSLEPQ